MSITDELRKYAQRFKNSHDAWSGIGDDLTAIADRIDAEHESACAEAYGNGVMSVPIALDESAWVELPKDADGEPWNRGNRVIDPKDPDGRVNTVWIAGDNTLITDDHLFIFPANELRHYHAPTVEDVLTEFSIDWEHESDCEDRAALLREYAAKLRLAKEDA